MRVSSAFKIAREAAKARGEKHFDSGKPCKYGHSGLRLVSTGRCKQCHYTENRDRSLRRSRAGLPTPTRPCPECCELCGKTPKKYRLNLDHDHKTGQFRGWICGQCNASIGLLGDDVAGLQQAIFYLRKNQAPMLPSDSTERKQVPLATGVFDYFPSALIEVAKVSWHGNQKHNPGQPLHWSRGKSADHADTIQRHFAERGTTDPEDGLRHSAKLAWRALALLQLELEAAGAPVARGAKLPEAE